MPYLQTVDAAGNRVSVDSIENAPREPFTFPYYSASWTADTADGTTYRGTIVFRPHDFWTQDARLFVVDQQGLEKLSHSKNDVRTHSLLVDSLWVAALHRSPDRQRLWLRREEVSHE